MSNFFPLFNKMLSSATSGKEYFDTLHVITMFYEQRVTSSSSPLKKNFFCDNCESFHVGQCLLPTVCNHCHLHHRSRHCPLQHGYRREIAKERSEWKKEVLADEDSVSVESGFTDCTSSTYSSSASPCNQTSSSESSSEPSTSGSESTTDSI